MNSIKISVAKVSLIAELNDSPTAQAIWEALPIESIANDGEMKSILRFRLSQSRSRKRGVIWQSVRLHIGPLEMHFAFSLVLHQQAAVNSPVRQVPLIRLAISKVMLHYFVQ